MASLPRNRRIRPAANQAAGVVDAPEDATGLPDSPHEQVAAPAPAQKRRKPKPPSGPSVWPTVWRHVRTTVGIIVVVAASIAVAWGIRHHVMTSPRFAVRTIRVEGTKRRNPEFIAQQAGIEIGKNSFTVDVETARLRLLNDPWIDKAHVRRKLPSTIDIDITEREASAAVAVGPDLYLCTHEGEIFKKLEPGDPSSLVVITGLTADRVASDRVGAIRRVRAALDLLAEYERRGPSKRFPAQEIHLADEGTMRMTVGKEAVTLEMGVAPYRQKVLRVARVVEEIDHRHANPGVVFLDNEAHPDRVVVRMR